MAIVIPFVVVNAAAVVAFLEVLDVSRVLPVTLVLPVFHSSCLPCLLFKFSNVFGFPRFGITAPFSLMPI